MSRTSGAQKKRHITHLGLVEMQHPSELELPVTSGWSRLVRFFALYCKLWSFNECLLNSIVPKVTAKMSILLWITTEMEYKI